jgi:hypothetical protein
MYGLDVLSDEDARNVMTTSAPPRAISFSLFCLITGAARTNQANMHGWLEGKDLELVAGFEPA